MYRCSSSSWREYRARTSRANYERLRIITRRTATDPINTELKSTNSDTIQQLSLFQEENLLLNGAIQDLHSLRLEEAKKAFHEYRDIYPNGDSVDDKLKLSVFLLDGLAKVSGDTLKKPEGLCHLWEDFENYADSIGVDDGHLIAGIKKSFFKNVVDTISRYGLADAPFLADQTPTGYVYIQAGDYDRGIASLQACLPLSSENAHIYGYLGDAHLLKGDHLYARKLYLEAFLIDPIAIDWRHFKDGELIALTGQIREDQVVDHAIAAHWLPSYAYIRGIFRPKAIRQLEVLKTFVDDFLRINKMILNHSSQEQQARLFLKAIILCDNEVFLRMVKGIDYADIRRRMKEINEPLFLDYMRHIGGRNHNR
jgi:tetratricopeptide (TPR) repeat protein